MSSQTALGVVIPAYKLRFLDRALASLANQTDRGFRVYLGDDASPEDLRSICLKWNDKLDLHYTRFTENLGGTDLVAQWNRCIALAREEWIWLFSDDDEADPNCIAAWRAALAASPRSRVFHFDVVQIDGKNEVIRETQSFPENLSARQFMLARFHGQLSSYAPDYIFNRAALQQAGGFRSFPLAWCSDDATWATLSAQIPICAIRGAKVRWRLSGLNISSLRPELAPQKIAACIEYLTWVDSFLKTADPLPGDPDDDAVIQAGRWWFYAQAQSTHFTFGPIDAWRTARCLSQLRQHTFLGSMARICVANMRQVQRHIRRTTDTVSA